MAGVFHVQFGINETPLSRALEYGQFDVAEKMIKECTSASYLDEGCYTRTPLVICLKPRLKSKTNFHIAKLLVERGADPNIRIPNTDGAEFIDPGQSPLELVTELFYNCTRCKFHSETFPDEVEESLFNKILPMIGLHKKRITSNEELQEHIYGISVVLLGYGANVNVMNKFGNTPLRDILRSCRTKPKLLELFLENGADVNAQANGSFTPLMHLCSIQFGCSTVDGEWRKEAGGCLHENHEERNLQKLETVFEVGQVEINKTNRRNQTALFVACACSHFAQGKILLREGASPDFKGGIFIFSKTTNENNESSGSSGRVDVTPLIAALVSPKIQAEIIDFPDKPLKLLELGDIIDTGKFCSNVIWEEFCEIITSLFSSFTHLLKYGPKLISLMFGSATSDLVQQTTRNIFHDLFKIHGSTEWKTGRMADLKTLDLQNYWKMDECVDSTNCVTLSFFVSKLRLPTDLVERFEIEWLRLCLCAYYANAMMACSITSDSYGTISSDEDSDDYEDDSDMEFW
ncbi:uncharacterized protein LOC135488472 isoform X2 [Lineus longissimus]